MTFTPTKHPAEPEPQEDLPSSEIDPNLPDPRDQKTYYFRMTPFRFVATSIIKVFFLIISDLQVSGAENMPSSGAVVLASNHLTNIDVFPIQFALKRTIFFMGKEELFRNPALDWALRQLGGFPVYRGANDAWAIRHAERVLEHRLVLGIFPEGTRNRGQGLRPAKTGAARLALKLDCPIVPMAVHGTQYLFRNFPKRIPVKISIGEPIYAEHGETVLNLTDRMMFALADMLPPEARGAYRYRPAGF